MEAYDSIIATLALTMGASWAAGINLYAVLLVLGLGGSMGRIDLPGGLEILQNPMVLGAAGLMYCVEFFADKIPGVDSAWDTLQTFVRIPAGAMLAAGAVGDVGPVMELASAIMGGGMATTSHATKASTRLLINTSPEPVTNWTASFTEDAMVFGGLWAALNHPVIFLVLLVIFIAIVMWLLPKLWRLIKIFLHKIAAFFGRPPAKPEPVGILASADSSQAITGLERLAALRASGALTEEEFQAAKRKMLGY